MKIKGFTPIFDSLAKKYDPYTALVYGKIWRICDWSVTGICTMSNEKIAEQIGLSEKTIRRKKEKLAEDKLIKVVGKSGVTDTVVVCHEVVMRMELDYTSDSGGESVDSQSKSTDGESYKDSNNKHKDILDATVELQGKEDILAGYPPEVTAHLKVFIAVSGIRPIKSQKGDWIKTAREWTEMGIPAKSIKDMYAYAVANEWGVARPGSITSAYNMMQTKKTEYDAVAERSKHEQR